MPRAIYDIRQYEFSAKDKLFLDTNTWMLGLGISRPDDERVAIYKDALDRMNAARSQIYADWTVFSEFSNACFNRLHKGRNAKDFPRPKDFRKSPAFAAVAKDITDDIKQILAHCRYLGSIKPKDIRAILPIYTKMDFNDHAFAQLCAKHRLTIATEDSDFALSPPDLTILTANRQLLKTR